ncbi:DUF3644 domain-containing protein [Aggregatilinea lenta]|uniref:DUF3644 domain-containing protein n=1 Tax=Aggregatilinea lenta TaxID=913108 RepID=UPI000E5B02C2|nr:DUF3644 domain-containing protein [Aggregatilinea lenta]
MSTRGLSQNQRRLLSFLKDCERLGREFSLGDIAANTGWTESTVRTYETKGYWSSIIFKMPNGNYVARGVLNLSESNFHQEITQTQTIREFGHHLNSRIAKALLSKSKDNMILALELYNRPSLQNRLDGFTILFCTAWEQLLKAQIAERDGDSEIYRTVRPGRRPETISLQDCLNLIFPDDGNPVRRNIEQVKDYRDKATHLLMPEAQGLVSQVFQAGVINYEKHFCDISGIAFLPENSTGLMTLVGRQQEPDIVKLRSLYGEQVAGDILNLVQTLQRRIAEIDDDRFAVVVEHRLVFARRGEGTDITLAHGDGASQDAVIIRDPIPVERGFPYSYGSLWPEIYRRLIEENNVEFLATRLRLKGDAPIFNRYDLTAILAKEGWQNSINTYHYHSQILVGHRYSQEAVDYIVDKIVRDPDYVSRAINTWKRA